MVGHPSNLVGPVSTQLSTRPIYSGVMLFLYEFEFIIMAI